MTALDAYRASASASLLIALAVLAAAALALGAAEPAPPPAHYLFTSFRGNGEDGLHLAWSRDGHKWAALGGDRSRGNV
jgi:hypothetical protein